jgi:Tfp pilus assembly protein PilF
MFLKFPLHQFPILGIAILLALGACAPSTQVAAPSSYRTISVDPRRDTDQARALNDRGMDLLAQGHLELASDAFTRALEADVEFGPAHNNLGLVYYRQKDMYKAAWEFQYAINLIPRFAEPHNNLGLILEDSGKLDDAIDKYRQAVALSPDIQFRANLGRSLIRRDGHTEEVRTLLSQLLQQDSRPQWRDWARRELAAMGDQSPATVAAP